MGELLRKRVETRLSDLGMNPLQAAVRGGFDRSFFYDLINGKKNTLRESSLAKAANVLDCDPEFLIGIQDAPRRGMISEAGFPITGFVERGAWRDANLPMVDLPSTPIRHDPRYPSDQQCAFYVRDDHAHVYGIGRNSVVVILTAKFASSLLEAKRPQDVYLVGAKAGDGKVETTIVGADQWTADRAAPAPEIIGVVLAAHRVFGFTI